MKISLDNKFLLSPSNCIVIPLTQEAVQDIDKLFKKGEKKDKKSFQRLSPIIKDYIKANKFEGEADEVIESPASLKNAMPRIILYGLGEDKKLDLEVTRKACAKIEKLLDKAKISQAQMTGLSWRKVKDAAEIVKAMAEGFLLATYKFDKFKKDKKRFLQKITIVLSEVEASEMQKALREAEIISNNVIIVRDLINEDGDIMNPDTFEKEAVKIAKELELECEIFNKNRLQKLGCNLILEVGKGSQYAPRMLILAYEGDKRSKEIIALVGKGVTFDTGGTNLKTNGHLEDMQMDMGGAAAVLGVIKTAAELKIKKNLIAVIPCVENAIGSKAFKPGAIIKGYNGKTVEIINTDAEGRLILADALAYTVKNYKPSLVIDIATLTGSMIMTFGDYVTGMFGNDQEAKDKLFRAGEHTYERVWGFPIYDEYRDELKSESADVANLNEKYSGSVVAAAFLEHFINKDTKWVHLDIAGTAILSKATQYLSKGSTGVGVRLLVEFLKK